MKDYGSIESIRNESAKIILDSGETIYRDVDLITPTDKVQVGRVVCLDGYKVIIDESAEKTRRENVVELQNSIFSRGE